MLQNSILPQFSMVYEAKLYKFYKIAAVLPNISHFAADETTP